MPSTAQDLDAQQRPIPRQETAGLLHHVFESQAARRPQHPALTCAGVTLSYEALDAEADRIAGWLRGRGVGRGALVALYFRKCPLLFAALLGVLKAGAGYVPIDPKCPMDRVGTIIADAGAVLVLTHDPLGRGLTGALAERAVFIDGALPPAGPQGQSGAAAGPGDICYVIFTSGSTGRPKGVMVEHRNAVNFIRSLAPIYGVTGADRVYQGFSLAFDAAVEEVWAAWSTGGTLVVADEETARSAPDVAALLTAQQVTVFSTVPTFLAMIDRDLPTVRLLIVGGEACPPELVNRWAGSGRRMLNTYGPTEATVVATWAELRPGRPVTIGRPLPGIYVRVLDDAMRPVAPGAAGELYIGGAGVARGYINRPDLNGERFIADPLADPADGAARLYRSLDRVRLGEDGELDFLGRLDGQIKIRGFRVELAEIEAVLIAHPLVRAAAAAVTEIDGHREIAAFIVAAGDPDAVPRGDIADLLQSRLPDYMVPKYLDIIDEMPVVTSGKVDRRRLPAPVALLKAGARPIVPPATALETLIAELWRERFRTNAISVEDDFFLDLGGHSLLAAHVVTALRHELGAPALSVRDLYRYPTVRALAGHLQASGVAMDAPDAAPAAETGEQVFARQSPWVRRITVGLQAIALYGFYAVVSAPVVFALLMITAAIDGTLTADRTLRIFVIASFLAWPSMLALSIALKWLVIGRYRPGRYPLWSFYYFRWWLVTRFQVLSWSGMFVGTPLMSLYFRLMGAKVGRNCTIATNICSAFDLIAIGDDTSIGAETQLLGHRVEDGMLILAPVTIGKRCFIGMHCALGLDAAMADDSRLDDMSFLEDGAAIPAGEGRRGSPARPAAVPVPEAAGTPRRGWTLLYGLIHFVLIYAMGYLLILTAVPGLTMVAAALYHGGIAWGVAAAFAAVPVGVLWFAGCVAAAKWLVAGRLRPGVFPVHSLAYVRHWFLDYLLNNTRELLLPIYATTFFPSFLRLLGARIGRNAEISTVLHVTPDLLDIGAGSFCADAALVGGKRVYRGMMEVRANRIGCRSFIGNSALVPGGTDIGDDCLIGVMSTPPADAAVLPSGRRWLGSPGFALPRTQGTIAFDSSRTFAPSRRLMALRAVIDLTRIMLPGLLLTAGLVAFAACVIAAAALLPLWAVLVAAPLAAMALGALAVTVAAGLKALLVGTFRTTVKPLYSAFVWRNEVVNGVYETIVAGVLAPLMGTPFIAPPLRLMGCRIGRWVYLETTLFSEFDLVEIGDFAALNVGATIQTHLFEDRVMKTAPLRIGNNCTIGNMTVVLYGTEMQDGACLAPLSVLMKGETLPAGSRWQGVPTQRQYPAYRAGLWPEPVAAAMGAILVPSRASRAATA